MTARNLIAGDKSISTLKRESAPKRLSDGAGLYLLPFFKGGSHLWRFDYTSPEDGKRKTLSFGPYPDTGLALARQKAQEARELVAKGLDPSGERKSKKAAIQAAQEAERLLAEGKPLPGTFEAVAMEWLETVHRHMVTASHAQRTEVRFKKDVFPWLGKRPIADIEAPELLTVLRRITGRGAIETANRARTACGQVFRFGIASGHCARDPAGDLKDAMPPAQTRHLAALVEPVQVGKLLRDMHDYQGQLVTRAALLLSPLMLLRPGELRQMEWDWLDLDAAMLTVPGAVMKRLKADKLAGPPHLVPLARQAVEVLKNLQQLTGSGRYVFPALTSSQRCMSENTVRSALRRLGYGNDEMTAHGFRATARTMIAERLGIAPEVIEAQLAHAVADPLGRAYNRTQFLDQRRDMMQRWADYLDRLRYGAEVVPLPVKAV